MRARRRQRRWFLGASLVGLAACVACGSDLRGEAGQVAMRWFKEQLAEIGYVEHEGGLYATPPTEAPGLILGDAIEIQLRSLLISRVFPVDVTQEQREEGVEWSGQAVVTFEYRDRYHRSKESRPWSEWAGDFWVLTLARSEDQWTIRRTS